MLNSDTVASPRQATLDQYTKYIIDAEQEHFLWYYHNMSSKKNAIAYVQMALDAINTVVIYRYSILALLPFLMQNSLGISRWGWCWWTGLVAVVFSALSIQYHMRYNPQLMYDELGNKDSLKLANSRTMQKCVLALTDESLGSKYHEYILSKAVIDIMLTFTKLKFFNLFKN